ncbi:hypothetical protein [Arenimonas sp.]|uniref:hypothetical protein n=1 Tax=Arenimonas sp. TaxID=1872635 RepID=UPI0039E4BFAA
MSERIRIRTERDHDGIVAIVLPIDPEVVGRQAELRLVQRARVKRSDPVHKERRLSTHQLVLATGGSRISLGRTLEEVFAYRGEALDLELKIELEVDDGFFFDTEIEHDLSSYGRLPARAMPPLPHKEVHSPKDRFNFIANLRAIPAKARLVVLCLLLVGGPVLAVNAIVGARDQFVPESRTWFYDHSDSDGESESPLFKALAGSGVLGAMLWAAIRHQLKKYMSFAARLPPHLSLARGSRCSAAEIVSGAARVPIERAVVRIVAYNREHGQYKDQEKDGKKTRTVIKDFTSDARGIVLYEQQLLYLQANEPIERNLAGEVVFDAMFDSLYPSVRIGGSHGLSLCLEAQFLHPDYVDHDVQMENPAVAEKDFFAPRA